MTTISGECPHCGTLDVGFVLIHEYQRPSPVTIQDHSHNQWTDAAVCGRCSEVVLAVFTHPTPGAQRAQSPLHCQGDPRGWGFQLQRIMPATKPSRVPDHVPEPLPRYFLQAADATKRGDWDASGSMSRKTLDVCTKLLMVGVANIPRDMGPRIDALARQGSITEDLRQWAHQIRLDGNDAVHDADPFKKEEAEELLDFAELFLTYVYTLPGRLAARRRPHTASA
jgi:hypothetical protein